MKRGTNPSRQRRWTADLFDFLAGLQPLADLLIVALVGVGLAYLMGQYRTSVAVSTWPLSEHYLLAIALICAATPVSFYQFGLYRSWRGEHLAVELVRMTAAWMALAVMTAVIMVLTKTGEHFSRVWMGTWFLVGLSALGILRVQVRRLLNWSRESGLDVRHVIVVGGGATAQRSAAAIAENTWTGYRLKGYVADTQSELGLLPGGTYLGTTSELLNILQKSENYPDQLWIALDGPPGKFLRDILPVLSELPIEIRIAPDIAEIALLNLSITHVGGVSLFQFNANPMTGLRRFVKALEDRVLAVIILLLMAPVMLAIAIGVKLSSPGPVLFKQKRHGWLGEQIDVYKFRTMIVHTETEGQLTQARRKDERITPFGAWLRRTSLDELPQFFNVLGGSMSVVGPRPHAVQHNRLYKKLVAGYMLRHKVKPGITGWAQVNGYRGETDTVEKMRRRIEYDLQYIEQWSIWFDVVIILLTLLRGFTSDRAY